MLRKLLFFLLLLSGPLFAQTTVTGTIVDPKGNPYANGTASAYSLPASGQPVVSTTPVATNTSGFFSLNIPSSGNYVFTVCAPPVPLGPTQNPTPAQICFSSQPISVSGSALDVSSTLNAVALVIGPAVPTSGGTTPPATSVCVSVSPNAMLFGTVQTGTDSPPQPLSLNNCGTVPVIVGAVTSSNTDYRLSGNCSVSIPVAGTCVLLALLHPTINGAEPASSINISSNAAACDVLSPGCQTVALVGSGTPTPTFPLSYNCSPTETGSGTIASNEATPLINFHCGPNGVISGVASNNYASGSSPVLTATPDANQTFNAFSGTNCGTTSPATVTVSAATTCTASFSAPIPNVTLNIAGAGTGTGTTTTNVAGATGIANCVSTAGVVTSGGNGGCSVSFPQGTVLTLTEAPNGSSSFVSWGGVSQFGCTTASTCQITLNSNLTVSVNFTTTAAAISLIQTVTNCSVSGTTAVCPWGSSQAVGDMLLLGIGVPDATTTISSVTDTKGNTYTSALGPTTGTNLRQTIYYAPVTTAAAGGANSTTVTFSSGTGAISGSNLTANGGTASGNAISTASVTLTNNNLELLKINSRLSSGNGPGAVASISGNGTWVRVLSQAYGPVTGSGTAEILEVWRAMGTGSSGVVTINYTGTNPDVTWAVDQFSGTDLTGSNGSGAIGITASNSGLNTSSPATVTMGTFGSASNGTYGAIGECCADSSITANGSMTQLSRTITSPTSLSEWAVGNISPVTATFTGTSTWGAIGIEIKAGATGRRDVRALEYSGLATSTPVDVSAAATGTSSAPASGSATTTLTNDLVTCFSLSSQSVSAVSSGFTQEVKNTFGDDIEDKIAVATAAFNCQPTLSASGNWVESLVAWKASGAPPPSSFSLTMTHSASGTGSGTVTSNAGTPTLSCTDSPSNTSGACSSSVIANSTVALTANPGPSSTFGGYSGITGCSSSPSCNIPNITNNSVFTATFNLAGGVQQYYTNASTGNNNNSGLCAVAGTPAGCTGPWATIQGHDAVIVLGASGTQINVAAGSYTGPITTTKSGTATQRISYVSTTPLGAHITVANWLLQGSYTDVNGFDLTNPAANGFCVGTNGGASSSSVGSFEKILNNYCHDVATSACGFAAGIFDDGTQSPAVQSTDNQIIGNIVRHAGTPSCTTYHGIYADGPRDIIQNNIVSGAGGWGLQRIANGPGTPFTAVISNNTFFNNGGGILLSESNNAGFQATVDYTTIENNIVVNNGGSGSQSGFGINYYHVTGLHNFVTNNLIYSNLAGDLAHHGSGCGTNATSTTPATGLPISGSDANGNGTNPSGGCPADNSKTDLGVTSTFASFQSDFNAAPAGAYNVNNYKLKSTSNGVNSGATACASSPGITPCVPGTDLSGINRPQGPAYDIGAFEQ